MKIRAECSYLDENITGNKIVDGGVLSNFPIELMMKGDPNEPKIMGKTDPNGAGTLGFLIDEELDVAGSKKGRASDNDNPDKVERERFKVKNRIQRIIDTMTGARDQAAIRKYAPLICRLPAKGYGTTEFDMKTDRMNALVEGGENAMRAYFRDHPTA